MMKYLCNAYCKAYYSSKFRGIRDKRFVLKQYSKLVTSCPYQHPLFISYSS